MSGADTTLGRELGGRELSGGQWQRIALPRAFMGDNDLLVLDEPTAELDPRGEAEVFQRFAELTRERMTILISHRFSTPSRLTAFRSPFMTCEQCGTGSPLSIKIMALRADLRWRLPGRSCPTRR